MDKASLFGVLAGIALVLGAILLGGNLLIFINVQGLLIVAGGTLGAVSVAFPFRELKQILSVLRRVFNDPGNEMAAIVAFLDDALKVLKRDGHLGLEKVAGDAPTAPLRRGLLLIADGTDSRTIRQILQTEQVLMEKHHRAGQKIFNEMGKFAPAFGMVGTLIGLVQMLANLDDPSAIGPAMAVALLTTFYGAVAANVLFLPMVTKLDRRIHIEVTQIQLTLMGLESIHRGDPGSLLREKMQSFLLEHEGSKEEEELKEAA
ncbi:MAG: motility protein A [Gemmatimonadales bacterium]|nr:MAG: motility protein A [Gemmatimonadales bacterium]